MPISKREILHTIDACNGEIRIMAQRYGQDWYCAIATIEQDDSVWELWDDLVGGDNDYFNARNQLKIKENFFLADGVTPESAMENCFNKIMLNPRYIKLYKEYPFYKD